MRRIHRARLTLSILLLTGVMTESFALPASTDFVRAEVAGLRNELSVRLNTLSSTQAGFGAELRTFKNEQAALNQGYQDSLCSRKVAIGELHQGGLVFYVDETGQHGLVVSLNDLDGGPLEWRNGESGERITNAHADGLYAGETNTRLIIAAQTSDNQDGKFAALIAATYRVSFDGVSDCTLTPQIPCYGYWMLPSAYELSLVYSALKTKALGNFDASAYWSSTEESTTTAYLIDFDSGERRAADKSTLAHLRAVHAF